jgi:hypothetical protein
MKKYLLLALLPFAACQKDKNDDKKDEPVLMPFAIGNRWETRHIVYNQDGSVGDTYDNTPLVIINVGTRSGYFLTNDSSQLFSSATEIRGFAEDEPDEFRFLKSAKVDTFSKVTDVDGTKIVSIAFPDSSKVLTYNCYRNEYLYYQPGGDLYGKDVYYVSPGIGIVREDWCIPDGNGGWRVDYRDDLKSYILK